MISHLERQPTLAVASSELPTGRANVSRPAPRALHHRLVVGIVAAYPSVRAGLATLLQDDIDLSPSAIQPQMLGTPTRSTTMGQVTDADVILVSPNDLDHNAIATLVTLAIGDQVPLVWLGRPSSDILRMVAGRPGGFVAPNADGEALIAAIRAAYAGLVVQDPSQVVESSSVESGASYATMFAGEGFLSPREREVLALVASGLPNKAIARELGISDHTVKFHVSSLLTKLGAGSRTEAVTVATRMGLLSL